MSADEHLPLTEQINSSTADLDRLGTHELLRRINDEDRRAAWAVERELEGIAATVDAIVARIEAGGNLHYFGAGSSGRIAVLDAAEIPPTFAFPAERVVAHIAGGAAAVSAAVEAAEDDERAGESDVAAAAVSDRDAVVGLSASGRAPYVVGALRAATVRRALTIAIVNSPESPIAALANIAIVLLTGPEVVAGSTRMKAGSAQKMALNAMSTAVMVKLGKVYGNLMVELKPTNQKLRARAERLTATLAATDAGRARDALASCAYDVKTAVVMLVKKCSTDAAKTRLAAAGGRLRRALEDEAVGG